MTGGLSWFVRNKFYASEAAPYPSVPPAIRAIIEREPVLIVKVASEDEKRAYREGWPDVFLPQTTSWSEPKVAFLLGSVDPDLLVELVTEAWYSQAPKYLRRQFDGIA